MASPLLVHVHVPKCAGQWLDRVIFRMYKPQNPLGQIFLKQFPRFLQLEHPQFKGSPEAFERAVRGKPWVRAISSQKFRHSFPKTLAGRPVRYVTVLREPSDQVLSFLRYAIAKYDRFPPRFREALPAGIAEMDLATAAEIILRKHATVVEGILASGYFAPEGELGSAVERLESLDFVGTVDNSQALVERVIRWGCPGEDPATMLPRKPVNKSESRAEVDDAVRALPAFQRFMESEKVVLSRELYRHARSLGDACAGDLPAGAGLLAEGPAGAGSKGPEIARVS